MAATSDGQRLTPITDTKHMHWQGGTGAGTNRIMPQTKLCNHKLNTCIINATVIPTLHTWLQGDGKGEECRRAVCVEKGAAISA